MRQKWHFPAHSPFILRHVLQHTLSSTSAELLLRYRTMHTGMASCPPNGMKNKADKRTGRGKGKFPICDINFMPWKPPSFPQEKKTHCNLEVDSNFLFINNFTLVTWFSKHIYYYIPYFKQEALASDGLVVKILCSHHRGPGSIPGQGTKSSVQAAAHWCHSEITPVNIHLYKYSNSPHNW